MPPRALTLAGRALRTLAIHSRASGSSRYARPKSAVSSAWRRARCFGEFNRGRVILFLTALLQVTCAGSGRIDVSRSRSCMRGRQVQAGRQTRGPPTGILANAGSKGVLSLSRAPLSTENPGDSVARGAHSKGGYATITAGTGAFSTVRRATWTPTVAPAATWSLIFERPGSESS